MNDFLYDLAAAASVMALFWTASRDDAGYGRFRHDGRMQKAHRVSYEFFKGKIPDGLWTDHLCKNKSCVNPAHLEAVTHSENVMRGGESGRPNLHKEWERRRRQTHCKRGHKLTEDNIYRQGTGRGCKICSRIRKQK